MNPCLDPFYGGLSFDLGEFVVTDHGYSSPIAITVAR